MITATYNEHAIPVKRQCQFHDIALRQIFRWLNPPEVQAEVSLMELDLVLEAFRKQMSGEEEYVLLRHGLKRSSGSGKLHEKLKGVVPRRRIQEVVNDDRKASNDEKRDELTRVCWSGAMTCWAMDDTHLFTDNNGVKQWVHNVKDLTSQYILPPVVGSLMGGEEVAENLRELFKRFGAPLVLKRDNGSNLSCAAVDKVLNEFDVIPLNSPPYYSRYNGSIEQANKLLKERIKLLSQKHKCPINKQTAAVLAAFAAHEENTQYKRSTKRKTPSHQFFKSNRNNPETSLRKEVINDINEYVKLLTHEYMPRTKREENSVKREAAEAVLEKRGYIKVVAKKQVSPVL